jgi:nucleoside-diphosphate-sugar epimerase
VSLFYEAIRTGGPLPISLEKGLRVVELVERVWPTPRARQPAPKASRLASGGDRRRLALVTGASGFIGTHLVNKLLAEGVPVRALVRPNSSRAGRLMALDVDIVEGNLADGASLQEATRGVHTIYHGAIAVAPTQELSYKHNLEGTGALVEGALAHGVHRIVFLSSAAVYEIASLERPTVISEETPYLRDENMLGWSARSKIAAERLLLNAHRERGLGVTIVRPGIVIGPLGPVFFPHLGYRFGNRFLVLIQHGKASLPLTYVENTVDGIYRAATVERAVGQIYNLVDDGDVTVEEYLRRLLAVMEHKLWLIDVPYLLLYFAAAAYEGMARMGLARPGVTSRAQLRWKVAPARFDNTKAKSELDWKSETPIDEGLSKTFTWFADNS